MNMYYVIQPKNFIIFFCVIITINILKSIKSKLFFVFLKEYFEIIKKFFYFLLLCLSYNYNKQIFYIKRNLIFMEKFHDKLLAFSYISSLKKYVFFNLILGSILYLLNYWVQLNIITYIYSLNILFVSLFIICIGIKFCFNKKTIKLLLYILLWVNIIIIIFICIKIINQFLVFFITKFINIKDGLKNKFNLNNQEPEKSDLNFFSDLKKKKKTKKILQEKSEQMRIKLLKKQKSFNVTESNLDLSKKKGLSSKRNINKTIYIEPRQNIDLNTQFERIKSELDAYNIQEKKFKAWSRGKGNDFTYPDESKQLFKEYTKVLKGLRPHLKSMKKTVQKQLKK